MPENTVKQPKRALSRVSGRVFTLNTDSLVPVGACEGKAAVFQAGKVLFSFVFACIIVLYCFFCSKHGRRSNCVYTCCENDPTRVYSFFNKIVFFSGREDPVLLGKGEKQGAPTSRLQTNMFVFNLSQLKEPRGTPHLSSHTKHVISHLV